MIVHVAAPGDIAVMKAVARCTRAALVTAKIDPANGQASELVGGTLGRDGQQQAFAWLRMEQGQLAARRTARGRIEAGHRGSHAALASL